MPTIAFGVDSPANKTPLYLYSHGVASLQRGASCAPSGPAGVPAAAMPRMDSQIAASNESGMLQSAPVFFVSERHRPRINSGGRVLAGGSPIHPTRRIPLSGRIGGLEEVGER